MLDDLDATPWEILHHAYGPAGDVPQLLRDLASTEASKRKDARWKLYGNLWHQGTVYQASAHAVPFLLELVREPSVGERHEILVYLAHLATGSSYLDTHKDLGIFSEERDKPDFEERLQQELVWVRTAREAVRAGAPLYARLLGDPEPLVRAASAHLLAHFSEDSTRNADWIQTHLASGERDTMTCAACVLSLGLLASPETEAAGALERVLAAEAPAPIRLAAALGLAWTLRQGAPAAVREVLREAAEDPGEAGPVFASFPWPDSDARAYCSHALTLVGGEPAHSLPALIAALEEVPPVQSWSVARAMLNLTFAGRPMPDGTTADQLTDDQTAALLAIAVSKTFWTGFDRNKVVINAVEVLEDFGVPGKPDDLRAFLGLPFIPYDRGTNRSGVQERA